MLKMIFFWIILFVLNLTSAVASKVCCLGCNLNLFVLSVYPYVVMRTVCPGDILDGKDGSYISWVSEHSWYLNSTDITEQFFDPALLTNKSNINLSAPLNGGILQFCASNIWGLALIGQRDFIKAAPLSSATKEVNATPEKKPFQKDHSDIAIPSEYIFYEWVFYILISWMIIEEIIRQVKRK